MDMSDSTSKEASFKPEEAIAENEEAKCKVQTDGRGEAEKQDDAEVPDDTITSLAGAKVFEQFKKNLKRSRFSSRSQVQVDLDEFVPPDGGYGWAVVLGTFFTIFWTAGVSRACGILLNDIIHEFPDKSPVLASWIPACMTSVTMLVGPLTSALSHRYSHRAVTMAGSVICFLSLSLSFLFFSMEVIFVCLGGFTGLGLGLASTPGTVLVASYFVKHRAKASAVCMAGSALGGVVLPFALHLSLEACGLRWTLLILGTGLLTVCLSASAYRPTKLHARIQKAKRIKRLKARRVGDESIDTLLQNRRLDGSQDPERRGSRRRSSLADSLRLMALAEGEESLSSSNGDATNDIMHVSSKDIGKEDSNDQIKNMIKEKERRRRSSLAQSPTFMALVEDVENVSSISDSDISESVMVRKSNQGRSASEKDVRKQAKPVSVRRQLSVEVSDMQCDAPPKKLFNDDLNDKEKSLTSSNNFGVALLKQPIMILLLVAVLASSASPAFFHLLPPFALQKGLENQAPLMLSVGAILDLVFRFVISFLLDLGWVPVHVAFSAVILAIGVSAVCLPFVPTLIPMTLMVSLAAIGQGGYVLTTPLILANELGVDQLNASYGLTRLVQAIGCLFFPLVAGYLWDSTGGLDASYIFIGGVLILGSLFPLLKPLLSKKDEKRESE